MSEIPLSLPLFKYVAPGLLSRAQFFDAHPIHLRRSTSIKAHLESRGEFAARAIRNALQQADQGDHWRQIFVGFVERLPILRVLLDRLHGRHREMRPGAL